MPTALHQYYRQAVILACFYKCSQNAMKHNAHKWLKRAKIKCVEPDNKPFKKFTQSFCRSFRLVRTIFNLFFFCSGSVSRSSVNKPRNLILLIVFSLVASHLFDFYHWIRLGLRSVSMRWLISFSFEPHSGVACAFDLGECLHKWQIARC